VGGFPHTPFFLMAQELLFPIPTGYVYQQTTRRLIMLGFIIAAILLIAAIFFFIKAAFVIGVVLLLGAIVSALFGPLSRRRHSV
jgi:hypothetical protein